MQNLNAFLLVAQVLLSISLITLVLLQHGKGADAGAAFGSGASGTVFGAKGSGNFLTRSTAIIALLFFLTCMSLAYLASRHEGPTSIMESVVETQSVEQNDSVLHAPVLSDLPPAEPQQQETVTTDLPPSK